MHLYRIGRSSVDNQPIGMQYGDRSWGLFMSVRRNVLGSELLPCSLTPVTGFYRDGCCNTGPDDLGLHIVCIEATEEFLAYSESVGNDLSTPALEYGFPGLKPGDRWCLCAMRWQQALEAGFAPPVHLESTNELALEWLALSDLKQYAVTLDR